MLGTVDRTRVGALLKALAAGEGEALLTEVAALAEFSPDWGSVLDALTDALHRVQVRQLVPEMQVEADGVDVDALAAQLRPEVVQLWYQMALNGRRDLPLAPSPRAGFEMSVLRMLAFRPADGEGGRPMPVAGAATRCGGAIARGRRLGAAPRAWSRRHARPPARTAPRAAAPPPPATRDAARTVEPRVRPACDRLHPRPFPTPAVVAPALPAIPVIASSRGVQRWHRRCRGLASTGRQQRLARSGAAAGRTRRLRRLTPTAC